MTIYRLLVLVLLGSQLIHPASAEPMQGGSTRQVPPRGGSGMVPVAPSPVPPQFNDPGRQLTVPQPGNPAQQLSPMDNQGQPDSLGIK
jgi:hypothetical protein